MDTLRYQMIRLMRGLKVLEDRARHRSKSSRVIATIGRANLDVELLSETVLLLSNLVVAWDQVEGAPKGSWNHSEEKPQVRKIRTRLTRALRKANFTRITEAERLQDLRMACMLRSGIPPIGACDHWPDGCSLCEIGPQRDGCVMRHEAEDIDEECRVNKEFDSCSLCPLNPKGDVRASK
jgi:hypothetical protein